MVSVRCLIIGLLAGAAHAGTVQSLTFGEARPSEVLVANGVEARAAAGFVVYQHGTWTPRVVTMTAEPAATPIVASPSLAPAVTSCGASGPIPRHGLAAATSASRAAFWPMVRDAECRHALPAGLLDAVVLQESRYRPFAVSRAGAGGLTQLMPRTATGLGVADRFEPTANIDGGARYLRSMLDHYRSVPLAVAAYNAGRGSVDRWGGIPLNRETPGYVRKVLWFFNDVDGGIAAPPVGFPAAASRIVSMTFATAVAAAN